ncbi:MAG: DUF58 domain-containing protein [Oscillospiraceae bacterium]|nr:DUF58 domain-containing protein [Oscillospiraceae bacterium]
MKEFRFFFAILFVMLFALCFAYYSRLMPLILVSAIFVCLMSLILSMFSRMFFTIEVQNGPTQVRRKDSVILKIRVKNNFIIPLTPVRIYIKVLEKNKCVAQKRMLITGLSPFREVTLNIQNDVSFRGAYQVGFEKAEFFDLLKLFRFTVKADADTMWNVLSFPRELGIDGRFLLDENEEDPDVSHTKPYGFNKDVFAYLREYRAGEPLRHIHWKLSARLDNLVVKQMEANHDHSSLVFCDFTKFEADSPPTELYMDASDAIIETAIALARGILSVSGGGGNSAVLFWQDKRSTVNDSEIIEVADARGYGELVRALSTVPSEPYGGAFVTLLQEFGDEIRLERAVYLITAQVTEELVAKLREDGLLYRTNVTLIVVGVSEHFVSDNDLRQTHKALLAYLTSETKINVFEDVLGEDCHE